MKPKNKKPPCSTDAARRSVLVRVKGVEPLRISSQEPKSCASANSAIPAYMIYYYAGAAAVNLRY